MIYYIQAFLLTFIEALCCRIFCDTFLVKRYCDRLANTGFFFILFAGFIGISFCPAQMYLLKAIFCILLVSVLSYLQYQSKLLQSLFLGIGYHGMLICIDRVMLIILQEILEGKAEKILNDSVKATIIALLCKNILFLFIILINKRVKPHGSLNLITSKEWVRFLFFPLITIVCMTAFAIEGETGSRTTLVTAFALVLSNFLVFYMICDVVTREKKILEMRVSQERTKNQIDMYQYMEGVYEEQRKKTHDFKNHLEYLYGLLKSDGFIQARTYIEKINTNWLEEIDYINTNNLIVNSILNQKFKQAKKIGIPILFSINDLKKVTIVDEDMVILLTNLLDNAIEACKKIVVGDRVIKMRFLDEGGRITISIRNPIAEPIQLAEGKLKTTKSKKSEHGIGMINIQNIVSKYKGENIWSCNEGYFTHSIIIEY